MINTVIFDMDGLLVNSEPLWQRARIEACGGPEHLQWTATDQEHVMGASTIGWATYLYEKLERAYTVDDIIERVISQMEAYYQAEVPLLPGAHETVALLQGRYTLGLASGAPYRLIHAVLHSAGWSDVFVEVLSADDMAHGKPAPDIYLEITRRLNVPVEQTAIFEDSANGILAGHAAGVKVIAVPDDYHRPAAEVLQKADKVLSSLSDFALDLLQEW